jgi:hypothetical protein
MERTGRGYRLSTGRELDAHLGLISIAWTDDHPYGSREPQWQLGEGFDGHLYPEGGGGDDEPWTDSERAELADYMIAQWQAFKARRSGPA